MKKVSLLGDSIRLIGYGKRVEELLGDGFEVFSPDVNCRFAKYTLRMLHDYKEQLTGSDIIHWNNGLWDICKLDGRPFSSENEYVDNMLRIAEGLKKFTDTIIFATTTPVKPGHPFNDNVTIRRYNEIIVPELKKLDIIINDLHTPVAENIEKYICDDLIHLSDEGIELCAAKVADMIKANI